MQIAELTIARQQNEDSILQLTRQVNGGLSQIDILKEALASKEQAEADQGELEKLRLDNKYLHETVGNQGGEITDLTEQLRVIKINLERNSAAEIQSKNKEYQHLQAQLDQERQDFVQLNNKLIALKNQVEEKNEQLLKLQSEFNEVASHKAGLEAKIEELNLLLRGEKANEFQVTSLQNKCRQYDEELVKAQNDNRQLRDEIGRLRNHAPLRQPISPLKAEPKEERKVIELESEEKKHLESEIQKLQEMLQLQEQTEALQRVELDEKIKEQVDLLVKKDEVIQELNEKMEELQEALEKQGEELQNKEDSFWARPSEVLDDDEEEIKAGVDTPAEIHEDAKGSELRLDVETVQRNLSQLQDQFDEISAQVVGHISEKFAEQIRLLQTKVGEFQKETILDKALEEATYKFLTFFENTSIREVCRAVDSTGQAYLLVEVQQPLEDQIVNKHEAQTYFVKESALDERQLQHLRSFVPESNDPEFITERIDQEHNFMAELEIEISQLQEAKQVLQEEFDEVKEKNGVKTSDAQNSNLMKENLQIREKNHHLQTQILEHRKRTQELNGIVTDLIAKGVRQSLQDDTNLNEHQLSYGRNIQSLLGSPIQTDDNRMSGVTESDAFSRDQNQDVETTVLEHIKSNLKVYLAKNPVIDPSNEIVLNIVFSMLNMAKEEIRELEEARDKLPKYKVDEKMTKKARTAERK